jgi:hypothetical protein
MIKYPHLLKSTGGLFMRSLLERLAVGDNPLGTVLHNDVLHFHNHAISLVDRPDLLGDLHSFFHTVVGIPQQFETDEYKQWKQIKKKYIKNYLLENFVVEKQKEFWLSTSQTNQLLASIHLGIVFKRISIQDIVYEQGKIQRIDHLTFSHGNYEFDHPILPVTSALVKHNFNEKLSLSKLWQAYLKQVKSTT